MPGFYFHLQILIILQDFCIVPEVGLEPTRACAHRILNPPCSGTGADTEGHRETKPRFYRVFISREETQRDRERHPVAVRIAVKSAEPSALRCTRLSSWPMVVIDLRVAHRIPD